MTVGKTTTILIDANTLTALDADLEALLEKGSFLGSDYFGLATEGSNDEAGVRYTIRETEFANLGTEATAIV